MADGSNNTSSHNSNDTGMDMETGHDWSRSSSSKKFWDRKPTREEKENSVENRNSRKTSKSRHASKEQRNARGMTMTPWIRALAITLLSLMALNPSDTSSQRQKLMVELINTGLTETKGRGRNHNRVLGTLSREGLTQDETNMLE